MKKHTLDIDYIKEKRKENKLKPLSTREMQTLLLHTEFMPEIYSEEDLSHYFGDSFTQKEIFTDKNRQHDLILKDEKPVAKNRRYDYIYGDNIEIFYIEDYIELLYKELDENEIPPAIQAVVKQHIQLLKKQQRINELVKLYKELFDKE